VIELWTGVTSKIGTPDAVCAELAEENIRNAKQPKRSDRIGRSLRPKRNTVNRCSRIFVPGGNSTWADKRTPRDSDRVGSLPL
jgi:hypothetical protein